MQLVDNFLNNITMYRLVLYYLIALVVAASSLSFFGILPFTMLSLLLSTAILLAVSWVTNWIFAKVFKVQTNIESVYISALILVLIIKPIQSLHDLPFLFWAAVWAMASKYILAWDRKHIFNPVAFGVTLTALVGIGSASWWVGTLWMLPWVLIGGVLVVRKLQRADLIVSFFLVVLGLILSIGVLKGNDVLTLAEKTIAETPLLFFAFIMLTEPLTTPPTRILQIIYGGLVGFLFIPQIHIGSLYTTPELALLGGNIFAYLVSPKEKLLLKLKEKIRVAPDIYDFVFVSDRKVFFDPGQYMEWTLGHKSPDSRGNRRYFTIASSPTEDTIRMGVKFYPKSSSFKKTLLGLNPGSEVIAGQRAGDFTLPKDPDQKMVLIAGGIGITPFRGMLKYLLDTNQKKQDIVLFYANKTASEFVYSDVLNQASEKLGVRVIYALTDQVPSGWKGEVGRINAQKIEKYASDFKSRVFYLSGPRLMVDSFTKVLKELGISGNQIKTDFFPGFT